MVTIRSVALLRRTLKEKLRDLNGEVTNTDVTWDWVDDEYRVVYEEVEVYFDDEDYDRQLERDIDDLVEDTG